MRAPTLVEAEARAWASLRLRRLPRRSDHEHLGAGPDARRPTHEAAVPRQRRRRGAAARRPGLRLGLPRRLAGRRRSRRRPQAEFAAYAAAIAQRDPELPRRDRRQRAEPQPLLAAAVQRGRHRRVGRAAYLSLLAATYDAVKAAAPETTVWGGALAPRGVDKPGTGRDTHLPDAVHPRVGRGVRDERPHDAGHGRLRLPPLRRQLELRRSTCRRRPRPPRARRPGQARARCSARPSTARARSGSGLPILYDEYGIESVVPPEKAVLYTGTEPADDAARRRARRRRRLRAGDRLAYCQSNVAGILLFHALDEPGLSGWQSGLYYPDGRRSRRSASSATRWTRSPADARQVRGRDQARPSRSLPAPVRSRSGAIATASTGTARAAARRIDHGVEERTLESGQSGRRSSLAPALRRALQALASRSCTRRGLGRSSSFVRSVAVLGALALAALTLAGLRRQRRAPPRRRGRRRRPPPRAGARPAPGGRLRRGRDHELLAARPLSAGAGGDRRAPECRRARRRDADLPRHLPRRLLDHAADARGAGGVRRVCHGDPARHAGDPRRDHRQRAEPESLLAAAVRRRRRGRRGARLPRLADRGL